MVLRRPGTIHRKIAMNSNMETRKSKKFKLRMKAKKEKAGVKNKEVRVAPEDVGLISVKAVKSRTRKNPLANVKMSNKKRNKILKQIRYSQKEQQKEADSEDEMEVEKVSQKKKANKPKAEGMECE